MHLKYVFLILYRIISYFSVLLYNYKINTSHKKKNFFLICVSKWMYYNKLLKNFKFIKIKKILIKFNFIKKKNLFFARLFSDNRSESKSLFR